MFLDNLLNSGPTMMTDQVTDSKPYANDIQSNRFPVIRITMRIYIFRYEQRILHERLPLKCLMKLISQSDWLEKVLHGTYKRYLSS